MSSSPVPGSLLARAEALAVNLTLRTGSEMERMRWSTSVLAVAAEAHQAGNERAAATARELARLACDPVEKYETLDAVLNRLQQALADAETSNTPVTEPGLAQDAELVADFVGEAREQLDNVEARLLSLEQDPENMEEIHSVFRSFHTIKGVAGFLQLDTIQSVSHEIETILDFAREGRLSVNPEVIDVILEAKDFIGRWLNHLGRDPCDADADPLCNGAALLERARGVLLVAESSILKPAVDVVAAESQDSGSSNGNQSRSVKISVEKLDCLVELVGEMIIAQALVRSDPDLALERKPRLARNLFEMSRIMNEVQRTALAMRMVPIGPLFQKMARLVRDLARKTGKNVELVAAGEEVQLDRNIVEELTGPLMHMVRNAVDHGTDTPAERAAAGKPATARIELAALHQSGQIVVRISDDGRGLDRKKILDRALNRGLLAPAANLSESECFGLIFQPGFSTAERVSDVSGRGVGMDVVKKQVQKLRGRIDVQSVAGRGSAFSLTLPLTLAIIEGLVVGVGEERYVIPIYAVREIFRPNAGMLSTMEDRAEAVLLRDTLLPVVRLYERFGVMPRTRDPEQCAMVVSECEGQPFCLMVDDLIGKQEVVIKSLGPIFANIAGVAGAAILDDGHVGLILEMQGVFGKREDAGLEVKPAAADEHFAGYIIR